MRRTQARNDGASGSRSQGNDASKRAGGKHAKPAQKVAKAAVPAAAAQRRRSSSPAPGKEVVLANEGDSTDSSSPVKAPGKKGLHLDSPSGSECGASHDEDSSSNENSDDAESDDDDEDQEERARLKRVADNAEERADKEALRSDPVYIPETQVKRGSALKKKRASAPEDLADASDSEAEDGATSNSRGKRRATGTTPSQKRPNKRATKKDKLARFAAASQDSVSSTASTASTQQYQHHPALADLKLPAVQVS